MGQGKSRALCGILSFHHTKKQCRQGRGRQMGSHTTSVPKPASCCCCYATSVVSDSVRPHRQQPTRLPIPGIFQARTLEWVAISFSNAWKWKVKVKSLSHIRLCDPKDCSLPGPLSMGFSSQEYWSGLPLPSPISFLTWSKSLNGVKAGAVTVLLDKVKFKVKSIVWGQKQSLHND